MGKITILPETTKDPISLMGRRAGICWGADITDSAKNYERGIDCIESNHGRVIEFPDVHLVIEGYSARVIREYYTHIGGSPSRLQSSTRYVNYKDFKYLVPQKIATNEKALSIYTETMNHIQSSLQELEELGVPREDSSVLLPLAMETKIVDKRNPRNLIDMSRNRMCSRAYWEFRQLFNDILTALREYSSEWKYIVDTQMKPKCEVLGYCPEKYSCGRKKTKQQFFKDIEDNEKIKTDYDYILDWLVNESGCYDEFLKWQG